MNASSVAWLLCWMLSLSCMAQDGLQEQRLRLRDSMQKKIFMLRGFPANNRLTYTATGELEQPLKEGPWSLAAIRIDKVDFDAGRTVIKGKRVGLTPMGDTDLEKWILDQNIEIVIRQDLAELKSDAFASLFYKVFFRNGEDWSDASPPYWRDYMKRRLAVQNGRSPVPNPKSESTFLGSLEKVGSGVSAPRVIQAPDPEYEEVARAAKYQGVVVLHLIVDEQGKPQNIRIVHMIGLGLDDRAVEAVRKWRFQPAKRNGKPVAVAINVEVNFNLY